MTEPLLSVRDLTVNFPAGGRQVVHAVSDVTFDIAGGEVLGLVGESGCGKTTVARCLTGQNQPSSGTISIGGKVMGARRSAEERRAVQMIFQDPYASLNPRMTVRRMLSELLHVHHLVDDDRIEDRCRELLRLVDLPTDALGSLPAGFSGGQRQRIAIARALAVEPTLIIADEPVSALDVSVQATILTLFADLRDRLGITFLFISHNLAVVQSLSDRVAVMYAGRIVEDAHRDAMFTDPRHPYTRALLDAAPRLARSSTGRSERWAHALSGEPPSPVDVPSGCAFHPRCPMAEDICGHDRPPLATVAGRPDHRAACHFRDTLPAPPTEES